jgi:hypothetical protein
MEEASKLHRLEEEKQKRKKIKGENKSSDGNLVAQAPDSGGGDLKENRGKRREKKQKKQKKK